MREPTGRGRGRPQNPLGCRGGCGGRHSTGRRSRRLSRMRVECRAVPPRRPVAHPAPWSPHFRVFVPLSPRARVACATLLPWRAPPSGPQGTDAAPAHCVGRHIEPASKGAQVVPEDGCQRGPSHVANRVVKEARPHAPVRPQHDGHPRQPGNGAGPAAGVERRVTFGRRRSSGDSVTNPDSKPSRYRAIVPRPHVELHDLAGRAQRAAVRRPLGRRPPTTRRRRETRCRLMARVLDELWHRESSRRAWRAVMEPAAQTSQARTPFDGGCAAPRAPRTAPRWSRRASALEIPRDRRRELIEQHAAGQQMQLHSLATKRAGRAEHVGRGRARRPRSDDMGAEAGRPATRESPSA